MCGRYVLSLRSWQVRERLAEQDMPADEAPDDDNDDIRPSYNFAPGYHGLIYRAQTSDRGARDEQSQASPAEEDVEEDGEPSRKKAKLSLSSSSAHDFPTTASQREVDGLATHATKYKLQSAKWGLIPFWTKRPPDYASQLRTINCRDDSLIENRGMWTTMKQRKRCIVIAEGFYEWLKKNNGKDKLPHFVKRKDGQLMCMAGLWDMVQYEGSEEKLYTYTIITTDSNKQLTFLHDRMPVILEPASQAMKAWLDPGRVGWDRELQAMLKPFEGELEVYPVDKAVGKVGNNSPSFVVPVDSKENKKNIANFFGNQKAAAKKQQQHEHDDERETAAKVEDCESNAPLPKEKGESEDVMEQAIKRETDDGLTVDTLHEAANQQMEKDIKREMAGLDDKTLIKAAATPSPAKKPSPLKSPPSTKSKTRSATMNGTVAKMPTKDGGSNKKITAFFGNG